jgi:hypothetical protein
LVENVFFTVFEIVTAHFWAFYAGKNRKFFLQGEAAIAPSSKSATAVYNTSEAKVPVKY